MNEFSKSGALSMIRAEVEPLMVSVDACLQKNNVATGETLFRQWHGVFVLLEMPAAASLVNTLNTLARCWQKRPSTGVAALLAGLKRGCALIDRYCDYVCVRGRLLPALLLDELNALRQLVEKGPVAEETFIGAFLGTDRPYSLPSSTLPAEQLTRQVRYLHQRFQVELVGVLRDNPPEPHLQVMLQALTKLEPLMVAPASGYFLWIARGTLAALLADQEVLSEQHKRLLSRMDHQLRKICSNTDEVEPSLLKDCLALIAASSSDADIVMQIHRHLALPTTVSLQEERLFFTSGVERLRTRVTTLKQALAAIRHNFILLLEEQTAATDFARIATALNAMGDELAEAGEDATAASVQAQASTVVSWQLATLNLQGNELLQLVDCLTQAENAIYRLEQQVSPLHCTAWLDDNSHQRSNNLSQRQLNEARQAALQACRQRLTMICSALENEVNHADKMPTLESLPALAKQVIGAMRFLDLPIAYMAMQAGGKALEQKITVNSAEFHGDLLGLFAEIMVGVDFHLECIEMQRPTPRSVLTGLQHNAALLLGELE